MEIQASYNHKTKAYNETHGIINRITFGLGSGFAFRLYGFDRFIKMAKLVPLHMGRFGSRFRNSFDVVVSEFPYLFQHQF